MKQLVMDNITQTILSAASKKEKKKSQQGGKVVQTKAGSDGFVQLDQIDQQNYKDTEILEATKAKKKENDIKKCKPLLKCISSFEMHKDYNTFWNVNKINLDVIPAKQLENLLKIFDILGQTQLSKN